MNLIKSNLFFEKRTFSFLILQFCFVLSALFWMSSVNATETVSFEELVKRIYDDSVDRAKAQQSLKLSNLQKDENRQSFLTTLELAPYRQTSELDQAGLGTARGSTTGTRLSVQQKTPWGLSLQASVDQKNSSDLPSATQIQSEESLGLSLDLWKNGLGFQSRALDHLQDATKKSLEIEAQIEHRLACENSVGLALDLWSAQQDAARALSLQDDSTKLNQTMDRIKGRGLISQVEYLGSQSELLSAEREVLAARLRLERVILNAGSMLRNSLDFKNLKIKNDPARFFDGIVLGLLDVSDGTTWTQKKINLAQQKSQYQADFAKHETWPSLNLNYRQNTNSGDVAALDFTQDDQIIELALKLNLNDVVAQRAQAEANVLKLKAQLDFETSERKSNAELLQLKDSLKTQMASLKLIQKQVDLMRKIHDDYRSRFLQGRINFQDYLRQKQSWTQMRASIVSESAATWKALTIGYLALSSTKNLCEEEKGL